jgi:hypothetical protein
VAEIPRAYIDRFTQAINQLSDESRAMLAEELAGIDMSQDVATIRDQAIEIMQKWCGGATDMVALLAAEFYSGLREIEIGEASTPLALSGRVPEATSESVRAFAQHVVDGDPQGFVDLCLERLDYEMRVSAANTVIENGRRDRRKPKYARVPTGAETCDFCLMLASRGYVYSSEVGASHTHNGCDCRVVPSWGGSKVEGYDPKAIKERWQDAIDTKAKERAERNGTTVAEERQRIMDRYKRAASNARARRKAR